MKFFVVVLAVIGIESIGNNAGQAMASDVMVTVNSILDAGSKILSAYHSSEGNSIKVLKDINQGDLTFFMELKMGDEVVVAIDESTPHDFCEDSLQGELLRGSLLPEDKTSCPIKKGDYTTRNVNDIEVSDTDELTQMQCGEYEGVVDIREGADNTFFEMDFDFSIDKSENNCKN